MKIDKQLFKQEWKNIQSKFNSFKWYCRFYDTQCAFIMLTTSVATVILFTLLVIKGSS